MSLIKLQMFIDVNFRFEILNEILSPIDIIGFYENGFAATSSFLLTFIHWMQTKIINIDQKQYDL